MSICAIMLLVCVTEMSGQNHWNNSSPKIEKISPQQFVERQQDFQDVMVKEDYVIVISFDKIPNKETLKSLQENGIELINYQSNNAYLAKVPAQLKAKDFRINGIQSIRKYNVTEKLSPELKLAELPEWAIKSSGTIDVAIMLIDNDKANQIELIDNFNITHIELRKGGSLLIGRIAQDDLPNLSASPKVIHLSAIEPEVQPFNQDNRAHQRVNVLQSTTAGGRGLTGAGVTVGVGDGGELGDHIDFNERVINYANGTYSSFGAHGDHVAGIIGGGGNLNPIHKGMAPECELVIQKTTSIINNTQAYYNDHQMVMTNNSYGVGYNCVNNGTYNYSSNNLDWQSREMPLLLHVFAAGNNGFSVCGNYPAGYKSVLRYYQSAKNVLTVGNVKEDRNLNGGSSKGPVADGRLKPEICGIGSDVMSTGRNYNYFEGSGTSMAAPSVVGTIALLNERYRQLNNGDAPEGALMKAIACNTADDLGNDGPDYAYGYGLINARRAVECIENNQYRKDSLSDGDTKTFTVPSNGSGQLKIMLYWHDVEAPAFSAKALINDLDIKVTAPDGTEYLPWVLNHDTTHVTDLAIRQVDTLNNIEQVTIDNPVAGNYTITISGSDVPVGPQEFFITYNFITTDVELTYPYGEERFEPGTTQFIQWDTDINNSSDFSIEYSVDGGNNWTLIASGVDSEVRHYAWSVPNVITENGVIRITKEGTTNSDENNLSFYILETPINLVATPVCEGHTDLTWDAIAQAQSYEIYKLSGSEMVVWDTVSSNSYSTGSLMIGEEFWFAVKAITASGIKSERSLAKLVIPESGGTCPWDYDLNLRSINVNTIGRTNTSMALTNAEIISLDIKNLGINAVDSFEIKYQVNGGTMISEMIYQTIPSGDSTIVSFTTTYDFSAAGDYDIDAFVEIPSDVDLSNNELIGITKVKHIANAAVFLPYNQDFEGMNVNSFTEQVYGIDGIEKWDFMPDNNGELDVIQEVSNVCLETSNFNNNSTAEGITFTLNMSNYVNHTEVDMTFEYKYQFININADGDFLYIRGSDTDPWIAVEEFLPYAHWVTSENDISAILEDHGQDFSSSFQVHFSQGRFIGYALDNFSINSLNALPVELTSFSAEKRDNNALLKWVTATEIDNEKFEIEVATTPLPLNDDNFERIGTVFGNGTTTTNQYYTFTDNSPLKSGLRYYRLKQINLDGTFAYSEIRFVDFGITEEIKVFPNPFINEINVWNIREEMKWNAIQIINATGQLVYETKEVDDDNQIVLNINTLLPDGMYFLRLVSDQNTMTFPILKSEK